MSISSKLKLTTKNEFSLAIEQKAVNEHMTHLDALNHVMNECHIQPEDCAKLVNASLKKKIEAEALGARLIRGSLKGGDALGKFLE